MPNRLPISVRLAAGVAVRLSWLVLAALTLAACEPSDARDTPEQAAEAQAALTVTVEPARPQRVTASVAATGTVTAWQELTVSSETSGLAIVEVAVEEGDRVEKGALLARLDDRLLQAQIAEQQAMVAEAEATLATAVSANARGAQLLARSAVSKETAEERDTTERTSRAKLDQAEAALQSLEVQLARTRIVAPVAGVVVDKPVVLGTVVQTGTELVRIVRDGRLEIAAKVPEQRLAGIRAGQPVAVTDAAGRSSTASVRDVAKRVDAVTRLGTVYVALPEDTALRIGMFARVSITVDDAVALTVPQSALTWRGGEPAVFAVGENDAVALTTVVVGARREGRVAIADGLGEGDRVVVDGVGFLNDGDRVRVVERLASGSAATAGTGEGTLR